MSFIFRIPSERIPMSFIFGIPSERIPMSFIFVFLMQGFLCPLSIEPEYA